MTNILAKIIYSLNSLICELLAAIMDWIFSLINEVGLDVSAITDLFKAKNIIFIQESLKTIGTWLALLFFVWGIFQFLFPSSEVDLPADNPFLLVLRFAMSILFVNYFYNFYQDIVYDKLIVPIFDAFNNGLLVGKNSDALADNAEKAFGSMTSGFEFAELQQIVNLLLIIVFAGIFVIAAFKFVIYHFERLFEATILLYFSPVAASTYTLKPMSQIFKTYIKLLLQQGICLIMNIITTKLVMAGLVNLNGASASLWNAKEMVGEGAFGNEIKTYVIYMMLLTACLNVGKKASVYVAQLLGQNGMSDSVKNGLGALGFLGGAAMGGLRAAGGGLKSLSKGGKNGSKKGGSNKPAETDNLKANSKNDGSDNKNSTKLGGDSKKPKSTKQSNSNSSQKQSGNDKQQRKESGKQKAANTGNAIRNAQDSQTKNASDGDLSSTQGQKGATTDNGLNSQSKDSNSSQENRDSKQDLENEKNAKNGADTGNYRRDSANSSNYKQNSSGGGSSSPKSTSATQSSRSGNNGSGNSSGQKTSVSSSANYVDNRKAKSSGSNATSSKSQTVKQPNQSQRNKQSKN